MSKGFGSFFNKPVEELLSFEGTPEEYIKFAGIQDVVNGCDDVFRKAVEMGPSDMHPGITNSGFTFVNQGAFGGAKQPLLEVSDYWKRIQQKQPLVFFDRVLLPACVLAVRVLARFFSVSPQEVFLFPNATYGLNTVLSNVPHEHILLFSTTYGSVKKMVNHYSTPPRITQVDIPLKKIKTWQTKADILTWFEHCIQKVSFPNKRTVLMIESVSSNTAIRWPYSEMAAKAKEINENFYVVVDAAHQLGMFTVEEPIKNVDAFITNGHKWLGTPSGVGVVILPEYKSVGGEKLVSSPLVVSHGSESSFSSATLWHGHTDYSPWLTVPWALKLLSLNANYLEHETIPLADTAEALLTKTWRVPRVYLPFMTAPLLRLIQLPSGIQSLFAGRGSDLQNVLHSHKIECPVKDINGLLHVRVSVFTYNTIRDFEHLASTVVRISEGGSKL
eukprot:TRINITY_DN20505_c0_g1_i1.p1 TRINITY_DN20505_c0_g1~~TRINITY_DN20505_c0_g1_i1.p1  ORF type:complete len:445 (+),score=44.85 TRINITY_DN20505_c0_g1_i1:54-1388(+)